MSTLRERSETDGGPRPLRVASGDELYGYQRLEPEEKKIVITDNLLFEHSYVIGQFFLDAGAVIVDNIKHGLPWIFEQPSSSRATQRDGF